MQLRASSLLGFHAVINYSVPNTNAASSGDGGTIWQEMAALWHKAPARLSISPSRPTEAMVDSRF